MLQYNEIKPGKVVVMNDEPYVVVSSNISRKQQRKPQNVTKLKNIINGRVIENVFHQNETAEEADLEKKSIKYLYSNRGENWFCAEDDPSNRFQLSEEIVEEKLKYMKQNELVEAQLFNDEIVGINLPIKVDLKVTEAPPNVKGNTAGGAVKPVTLETGAVVTVPMFIEEGEVIRVNTETGEYTERVKE